MYPQGFFSTPGFLRTSKTQECLSWAHFQLNEFKLSTWVQGLLCDRTKNTKTDRSENKRCAMCWVYQKILPIRSGIMQCCNLHGILFLLCLDTKSKSVSWPYHAMTFCQVFRCHVLWKNRYVKIEEKTKCLMFFVVDYWIKGNFACSANTNYYIFGCNFTTNPLVLCNFFL